MSDIDDFMRDITQELGRRVEKAAIHLTNKMKEKVNRSQPYHIGKGKKGRYYHGEDPSKPGEAPKKIRGDLQRSITYEMAPDKQSAKVGTNLDYGAYLELGTSKMAPRPYIRSTFIEELPTINDILGG